ncbi:hypothetical protein PBCV1_A435R [Paramecium bursaria Chlorella virus 1]|uniref:Uncharacterized protein n=1 Tax=Paramecium bursaria Chlorella virus 1 TaxID=10506 RepID=Q98486_PBCV1|nr:hypothetical protein PBCV1_A435R [Paramecium bursaria Chlorella virus 1]AAC96803.2 hypothetical protein [Paramecium bursaria Chlorella virus 1]
MGDLARRVGDLARVEDPVAGASLDPLRPRTNSPPRGPLKIIRPLASLRPVGTDFFIGAILYNN